MLSRQPFAYLCLLTAVACSKHEPAPSDVNASAPAAPGTNADDPAKRADPHAAFERLEVDEVEKGLAAKSLVAVDANSDDTREELGCVPGAVQLSNAQFELGELPTDKTKELVFYCGSEKCMSAPKAAARAKEAGYVSVKVMPAGIRGWVKAGKPVNCG